MLKKSARSAGCKYTQAFKATVTLVALRGDKTMSELCRECEVHVNQIAKIGQLALANDS